MTLRLVASPDQFEAATPLLLEALGRLDTLRDWSRRYLTHPEYALWVRGQSDHMVGLIGIHLFPGNHAEITPLAVAPDRRGQGRERIARAFSRDLPISHWWCETDDDAVGFYRHLEWTFAAKPNRPPGCRFAIACNPRSHLSLSLMAGYSGFIQPWKG